MGREVRVRRVRSGPRQARGGLTWGRRSLSDGVNASRHHSFGFRVASESIGDGQPAALSSFSLGCLSCLVAPGPGVGARPRAASARLGNQLPRSPVSGN